MDFPVEWCNLEHTPLIQLHSFTNRSLPLISLFCQSVPKCRLPKNPASPRGKPRGRRLTLLPLNERLCSITFGRILSAPTGAVETMRLQQPTEYTPSVSPFGLTAPPEVEPRRLRRSGRQVGDPYKTLKLLDCSNQRSTSPRLLFACQVSHVFARCSQRHEKDLTNE